MTSIYIYIYIAANRQKHQIIEGLSNALKILSVKGKRNFQSNMQPNDYFGMSAFALNTISNSSNSATEIITMKC